MFLSPKETQTHAQTHTHTHTNTHTRTLTHTRAYTLTRIYAYFPHSKPFHSLSLNFALLRTHTGRVRGRHPKEMPAVASLSARN